MKRLRAFREFLTFLRTWTGIAIRLAIEHLFVVLAIVAFVLSAVSSFESISVVWSLIAASLAVLSLIPLPRVLTRFIRHLGLIALFAVAPMIVFASHHHGSWWFAPVALGGFGVLPLVKGWWIDQGLYEEMGTPDRNVKPPKADAFNSNPASLLLSAKLLLNPAHYVDRLVHEVVQEDGYLRHTIQREFVVPSLKPEVMATHKIDPRRRFTFYVPLLQWPNGRLIDNLDTGASSGRVPVLLARQARLLTASLLSNMTLQLYQQYKNRFLRRFLGSGTSLSKLSWTPTRGTRLPE